MFIISWSLVTGAPKRETEREKEGKQRTTAEAKGKEGKQGHCGRPVQCHQKGGGGFVTWQHLNNTAEDI